MRLYIILKVPTYHTHNPLPCTFPPFSPSPTISAKGLFVSYVTLFKPLRIDFEPYVLCQEWWEDTLRSWRIWCRRVSDPTLLAVDFIDVFLSGRRGSERQQDYLGRPVWSRYWSPLQRPLYHYHRRDSSSVPYLPLVLSQSLWRISDSRTPLSLKQGLISFSLWSRKGIQRRLIELIMFIKVSNDSS